MAVRLKVKTGFVAFMARKMQPIPCAECDGCDNLAIVTVRITRDGDVRRILRK